MARKQILLNRKTGKITIHPRSQEYVEMTHDYEAALARFDNHLKQAEPDANGKILTRHGGAFFRDEEIASIRHALKLAHKVTQEPSEGMIIAACDNAGVKYTDEDDVDVSIEVYSDIYIAMIAQAHRELEE